MQAIISSVMTIFFYAVVIAAVWKLFQATNELMEIKNLLVEIRNNQAVTPVVAAAPMAVAQPIVAPPVPVAVAPVAATPVMSGPISLEAAEALLRQVGQESEALERAQSRS